MKGAKPTTTVIRLSASGDWDLFHSFTVLYPLPDVGWLVNPYTRSTERTYSYSFDTGQLRGPVSDAT
jgi:hypothetical protein